MGCRGNCSTWLKGLFILKKYTPEEIKTTELRRALSLLDLIMLGSFATLGVGLYVLAGAVSRNLAGPAAVLSFGFAAISSILSGICYAEFGCRVPRAGSAYVYSYVTVGEFIAFVIGWSLILEYVIGGASVARALIHYIDALPIVDFAMEKWLLKTMPMNQYFLADYPDFFAFLAMMLLTSLVAYGVKQTAWLNNIFSFVNCSTIMIVIIAGACYAKPSNWFIPKEEIPQAVKDTDPEDGSDGGEGGFMPFGFQGIMAGAAEAFYAFVGFDAIATCGEEAKNPQRNIPLALVISLTIISCAYFGVSIVLTMMWPYYDQHLKAPLPFAFRMVDQPYVANIVTCGAIFALCTSMLGSMFPVPRIVYAMASDGLLFKFLAKVHPKTQTPVVATFIIGAMAGTMAALFNLEALVEMMSIGTLGAYSIVAACVLILRFEHPDMDSPTYPGLQERTKDACFSGSLDVLFNTSRRRYPTVTSSRLTKSVIGAFCILEILLCAVLTYGYDEVVDLSVPLISSAAILTAAILFTMIILVLQPTATEHLSFKVPLLPWTAAISIMINTYLMMMLSWTTWVRFGAWMGVGFLIYFTYGLSNSVEAQRRKELQLNEDKR